MSYRNPQFIQPADPLAFSKGFEQGFSEQQAKFQADLEERQRLAKEADDALAQAYAMADLGPINSIDTKFNQALQDSLNNIVDSGDFANASQSERAKMIQDLKLKKAAYAKIGEIMSVDTEDWDLRNDPKLSAFRAAVLKGEDLNFDTKGLDFKVTGSFGEITLDDIANTRIINKAPYEEAIQALNDDFAKRYEKTLITAYSQGKSDKELELLKSEYQKAYTQRINNLDPDLKKYLEYNVAKTQDPNELAATMFNNVASSILDPSLIYARPKPEEPKEIRTKGQIIKDQTSEQRAKSVDNLGFLFDTSNIGGDYDIHSDTKFVNNMSSLGFNTQPVVNPGGEKGFVIKDQITNNAITIYPSKQTIEQTKNQLKSLITSQSTKPILP